MVWVICQVMCQNNKKIEIDPGGLIWIQNDRKNQKWPTLTLILHIRIDPQGSIRIRFFWVDFEIDPPGSISAQKG